MKQTWEWEEEDIEALIRDGVQESLTLDYKACGSLDRNNPKSKADLSKDVSAFANSAGGTLIYGVVEENHLPVRMDAGYDPVVITREWIEQVINSNIQRRINGIRIKQIVLHNSNPGRVMYVVHIPQSDRAPHMASDHKFYKRHNYLSEPMEEYEVRDVANRSTEPDLALVLTILGGKTGDLIFDTQEKQSRPLNIEISIKNSAAKPAEHAVINIYFQKGVNIISSANLSRKDDINLNLDDISTVMQVVSLNWAPVHNMPIWKGVSFSLLTSPITLSFSRDVAMYRAIWQIHAPGMNTKLGAVAFQTDGLIVRLTELGILLPIDELSGL